MYELSRWRFRHMYTPDQETTIKELTNMARIYRSFGFFTKAEELEQLLHRIRLTSQASNDSVDRFSAEDAEEKKASNL